MSQAVPVMVAWVAYEPPPPRPYEATSQSGAQRAYCCLPTLCLLRLPAVVRPPGSGAATGQHKESEPLLSPVSQQKAFGKVGTASSQNHMSGEWPPTMAIVPEQVWGEPCVVPAEIWELFLTTAEQAQSE